MNRKLRATFDQLLEDLLETLPEDVLAVLDEVPLIVEDEVDADLAEGIANDDFDVESDDLLGLHEGVPLTERSVLADAELPSRILMFRRPLIEAASNEFGRLDVHELREQIRITLLHEIGHHFGFDEDDLESRGYG